MESHLIAKANIRINAPSECVWRALVDPQLIRHYMFGADVKSDWQEGSTITWKGEWQGKPYEDRGVILRLQPGQLIQYSHFSPLSGMPDRPENYHTVTVELAGDGDHTHVSLTQDNNASEDERVDSEHNWETMLLSLKKLVEQPQVQTPEQMPGFNPALKRLEALVGDWQVEAIVGEFRQVGRARFEWVEGGAFLKEHWGFAPSELPPAATWIIGSDESSEDYSVLYYDTRSVGRVLHMRMEDNTWKIWRDDPEFSQRLTGTINPDGNIIQVYLEKSFDGKTWVHDFDLVYTWMGSSL
jgi:uncharacterized protein YndB with AHSA1/START domain